MIAHNSEISSIIKINDEIMATYSSNDKFIKVWKINAEGVECLNEIQLKKSAISIAYDNMTKTLAVMDSDCNIGIFQKDYTSAEDKASSEEKVEAVKSTSEVDDIDLENIDMDCLEDEVEEQKPAPVQEKKQVIEKVV